LIRATSAALFIFLVTLTGVAVWIGAAVHTLVVHLDGAVMRAEGIETKANATLINLDKGTAVWAASAKEQAQTVEDLATDAHGTLSAANSALEAVQGVAAHTEGTADAATSLLGSAQRSTDRIPTTLQNFDDVLADSRSLLLSGTSLLASGNKTNADLQTLLESHAIQNTLDNVAAITGNGNGVMLDFRKIADKETADWLKPVPWWKAPIAKGGQLIDITAAIARHTP
jgi:hypothetical protein